MSFARRSRAGVACLILAVFASGQHHQHAISIEEIHAAAAYVAYVINEWPSSPASCNMSWLQRILWPAARAAPTPALLRAPSFNDPASAENQAAPGIMARKWHHHHVCRTDRGMTLPVILRRRNIASIGASSNRRHHFAVSEAADRNLRMRMWWYLSSARMSWRKTENATPCRSNYGWLRFAGMSREMA